VRLTRPQRDELTRLVREDQPNTGKHRVRVQNVLVDRGLARYVDENGKPVPERWMLAERCQITDAGRAAIADRST
jgi:hypothetical protein